MKHDKNHSVAFGITTSDCAERSESDSEAMIALMGGTALQAAGQKVIVAKKNKLASGGDC